MVISSEVIAQSCSFPHRMGPTKGPWTFYIPLHLGEKTVVSSMRGIVSGCIHVYIYIYTAHTHIYNNIYIYIYIFNYIFTYMHIGFTGSIPRNENPAWMKYLKVTNQPWSDWIISFFQVSLDISPEAIDTTQDESWSIEKYVPSCKVA